MYKCNTIRNFLITGDCHRDISRLNHLDKEKYVPSETGIIILGDFGANFYFNKMDAEFKQKCQNTGYTFYCVRGNHEGRPENILTMERWEDIEVDNVVFREPQFPNIRYLMDGNVYSFNGHSALCIGGAYSVDKWYRLQNAQNAEWTGWFKDEQLTMNEMMDISKVHAGNNYDFILSHTCPFDWRPTDLFLSGLDQSTVDNTMEIWMQEFKDSLQWKIWLWGHFHADRIERPHCEIYYKDIENLETIWNRWCGEKTFKQEWWLQKSPYFYFDDNPWAKETT